MLDVLLGLLRLRVQRGRRHAVWREYQTVANANAKARGHSYPDDSRRNADAESGG